MTNQPALSSRLTSCLTWLALFGLMLLASSSLPASEKRLVLSADAERVALGRWLDHFPTLDEDLMPSELLGRSTPDTVTPWQPHLTDRINLGFSGQTWWFRLRLHNPGKAEERLLEFSRATLGQIGLYARNADGNWQWRKAGTSNQGRNGDPDHLGYAFRIHIPPGDSELLFQLKSDYALNTAVTLSTPMASLSAAQRQSSWHGLALGMTLALAAALLLLNGGRHSRSLLASFTLIQLLVVISALTDRGVPSTWWLDIPTIQHGLMQLCMMLLQMSIVWFVLTLLSERKLLTAFWHHALLLTQAALAIALMLSVVLERQHALALLTLVSMLPGIVMAMACIPAIRQSGQGINLIFWASALLLVSRNALTLSLTGQLLIPFEPYQWLLPFHLLHSCLLLLALSRTDTRVSAPAVTIEPPAVRQPADEEVRIRTDVPDIDSQSLRLPLRILLVEDNPWVRQVIVGLLRKQGIDTLTAENGMIALSLMEHEALDMVLMDCDLPELDGLSTTQVWRQRERELHRRPLPILAVTAHVSDEQRAQALDAGMNDFIAKPVDMRTLRNAILTWTGSATRAAKR